MKLLSGVAVGAAALALAGTTFLLSAVGTQGASCGTATAAAVSERTVAGYSGDQLVNAAAIMNAATALGLDSHAQLLGVMAAMGESGLRNITYGDYETSGVTNPDGSRTTSIGLFQQQDSWGSRDDRLNPSTAATLFYQRLVKIDGWESLPASEAIHRVQINSNPNHYAKWEKPAQEVTAALSVACTSGNYAAADGTAPGAWGGYGNGRIPQGQLAPIPWSDLGPLYLRPDAAAALAAMNEAFRTEFGYDLPINDAYRDYAGQVDAQQYWCARRACGNAAEPGTSNHGWALAVDVGTQSHQTISYSSATYRWLKANAGRYGWVHPPEMEPGGGGPQEAWHWEFYGLPANA